MGEGVERGVELGGLISLDIHFGSRELSQYDAGTFLWPPKKPFYKLANKVARL